MRFAAWRLCAFLTTVFSLAGCATLTGADPRTQNEREERLWRPASIPPAGDLDGEKTAPTHEARALSAQILRPTLALDAAPRAQLPIEEVAAPPAPPTLDLTVPPEDIWQRLRRNFAMPDLHHPLVAEWQSWYLNRPQLLNRIFERSRRYLFHVVEELEKRGMPGELALLPAIESAYNPHARSPAKAVGIWQFIPSTGKNYRLEQNWWVDERRDILASTGAALTYLQKIYEMHGDWHLALASYNWGEQAVARAIARNQSKGLPTDYASLSMPAETRNYVPKLQALKNIVAQPEVFGVHLPRIENEPYFDTVMKPERIDVHLAARLAEIPLEEFVALNPAYHRPVIPGDQAGPLVLPATKVGAFLANLARYEEQEKPLSNWMTYRIKRGETLAKIAAHHKISEARLKQINGITPKVKVGAGFLLLVPKAGALHEIETLTPPPPTLAAKPVTKTTLTKNKIRAKKSATKPKKPPHSPSKRR
ncbi:MAG: transglycosylase SLT domain-containing protein [Rhodocyclaceae bacterium]|nr:transglycosylase SLT domain-containing protein [Rhodocyclaceae bacterium]